MNDEKPTIDYSIGGMKAPPSYPITIAGVGMIVDRQTKEKRLTIIAVIKDTEIPLPMVAMSLKDGKYLMDCIHEALKAQEAQNNNSN